MSEDDAPLESPSGPTIPPDAISAEIPIINKRGLHARASAKFVQTVERFTAEVWVTRGGETVGGTSIMGLMMLSAGPGTRPIAEFDIDLPRPREVSEIRNSKRFVELHTQIWDVLRDEVLKGYEQSKR